MYNILTVLRNQNRSIGVIKLCYIFAAILAYGVTGNTSGFGPEESRFDP